MHLVLGDILGLGHSTTALGYTLALVITWFLAVGGLANFLIVYVITQVLIERRENQERIRVYDEAHPNPLL